MILADYKPNVTLFHKGKLTTTISYIMSGKVLHGVGLFVGGIILSGMQGGMRYPAGWTPLAAR